jgi:anti-anti-sigma regulatory factor
VDIGQRAQLFQAQGMVLVQLGCPSTKRWSGCGHAGAPVLASSIQLLSRMSPTWVVVDVADVTFAGSALPNFLATMRGQLPPGCSLMVRHPRPMLRRVLQATGMTHIVSVSDR